MQLILAVAANRHAFEVDINTDASVYGSQHGQVFQQTVAHLNDYYRTGSDTNVILSILTLLVYLPVGAVGGSYHKLGNKKAALMVPCPQHSWLLWLHVH